MYQVFLTCVAVCACTLAVGGEPQSVLVNPPASAPAEPVVVQVADSGNCCNCPTRQPRRTHTHNVTEACCSDGCQTYSVRTVEDEVTRRRWFGGGTVVRKNSRTVQRPVR